MSSVTSNNSSAPSVIAKQLAQLRGQLTRWLTIHGAGRWLAIVLAIIVADIIIDRFFQMDFAQRGIMLTAMVCAAAWFLFTKVLQPLMFNTSQKLNSVSVATANNSLVRFNWRASLILQKQAHPRRWSTPQSPTVSKKPNH